MTGVTPSTDGPDTHQSLPWRSLRVDDPVEDEKRMWLGDARTGFRSAAEEGDDFEDDDDEIADDDHDDDVDEDELI